MENAYINILNLNKSKEVELDEDERIDKILKDVTLKRPISSYNYFYKEQYKLIKATTKDYKIRYSEIQKYLVKKWNRLKDKEKKKYEIIFEEEIRKYKADIELVHHYLFKDINTNTIKLTPTAFRIYLNEKLREGFEKGIDPKEVKKEASFRWEIMPKEEKQVYIDKKKENDNWIDKARNLKIITPISLFVQKKIIDALSNGQEPPLLKDIKNNWENISENEKKCFINYANLLNLENEKIQDLYEIIHGIKPKKPSGAFQIFLKEKIKNNNGEILSLTMAHKMWGLLSEEEKEKYLLKSHRCLLAYKYKKMIYKKKMKKFLPKKPINPFQIFLKEKKGIKLPKGVNNNIQYWSSVYVKLPMEIKNKYKKKSEKEKENYLKKNSEIENKIFDIPKRPISGFYLYVNDRIPDLQKEQPNEIIPNLIKKIAKEWQEGQLVDTNYYNIKAENEIKRYKKQMKEFNKFGYYTRPPVKNMSENEYKDDKDEEKKENEIEKVIKIRKKKRIPIISSKKSKRKREYSPKFGFDS